MVSATGVRSKLQTKVFGKLGQIILLSNYTSSTIDKWGDALVTYATASSVTAVPYNYVKEQLAWEPFGNLTDGETMFVVPYGTTVGIKDKIVFDTKTWYVKQIEDFPMGDGTSNLVVAKGILLARQIN
jgi:hypothetical protein